MEIIQSLFSNFTSNLQPLLWLAPFIILAILAKSPRVKGMFGEWLVSFAVKVRLDKSKYHLFNNVTLPTEDGSTQIDHIIVSKYGVFVIETKFMKGWIYGTEHQKQWTQKIYKKSFKFQNPLHQNYKHHKALEAILQVDPEAIFSVIVFTGDSTFKTQVPPNVTYSGGVISFVESKSDSLLDDNQVKTICQQIEDGRLVPNRQTHKAHVTHVKEIVATKPQTVSCPKCGSEMVKRTVKKGEKEGQKFWGCSRFPKCRGIQALSD